MIFKRINITLPEDVLAILDNAATADYTTRSAYIREAIILKQQFETSIQHEVTEKDSVTNIVRSLHSRRLAKQYLRKMDNLTYSQLQD